MASGRLVRFWNRAEDLPALVAVSIPKAIKSYPAVGWVRASAAATEDVLADVNELRKENEALRKRLTELTPSSTIVDIPDLAGFDDEIKVNGKYIDAYSDRRVFWSHTTNWRKIFAHIAPYLTTRPVDQVVKEVLAAALFHDSQERGRTPDLDDQIFRTIAIQLEALGLVKVVYSKANTGLNYLFWSLTEAGKKEMYLLRTVRRSTSAHGATTTS